MKIFPRYCPSCVILSKKKKRQKISVKTTEDYH